MKPPRDSRPWNEIMTALPTGAGGVHNGDTMLLAPVEGGRKIGYVRVNSAGTLLVSEDGVTYMRYRDWCANNDGEFFAP